MLNSILSSLITKESYKNYKKTQQGVLNILLSYLYRWFIVYAMINNPTLRFVY